MFRSVFTVLFFFSFVNRARQFTGRFSLFHSFYIAFLSIFTTHLSFYDFYIDFNIAKASYFFAT